MSTSSLVENEVFDELSVENTNKTAADFPPLSVSTRSEFKRGQGGELYGPYSPPKRSRKVSIRERVRTDSLSSIQEEVEEGFSISREEPSWDHNLHQSSTADTSFSPRTRSVNFSTSTQVGLPAMELDPKDLKMNLLRYIDVWEDDFSRLDASKLSKQVLEKEIPRAEDLKTKIRDIMFDLSIKDPAVYTTVETDSKRAKDSLVNFLYLAKNKLSEIQIELDANSSAGNGNYQKIDTMISFKAQRVDSNYDKTVKTIDDMSKKLIEVCKIEVSTDAQFINYEDQHTVAMKRAEGVIKEATFLMNDAASANKIDKALALDKKINDLKSKIEGNNQSFNDLKTSLGLIGSARPDRNLNLECPKFDGKPSGLDYFTFRKKFESYTSLVRMSTAQKLHLLQNDCISCSTLKRNLSRYETVDEVFEHLERHFGNVQLLLKAKQAEFLKIGRFPRFESGKGAASPVKQKEWLLNVESKLSELIDLAENNQIENNLYYSDIIEKIEILLPENLKDEFSRLLTESGIYNQGKELFTEFVNFLDVLIARYTTKAVRYQSSYEHVPEKSRNLESKQKTYNFDYCSDEDGGRQPENEPTSSEKRDSKQLKGKKQKQKSTLKDTKTVNKIHQSSSTPQLMDCPFFKCQEKHSHLFYCSIFQKQKDFAKRLSMATGKHICMRCLRIDSAVDLKNRKAWWENHEKFCKTDFACTFKECKDRAPNSQRHMLVCCYHYKHNISREDEFMKSLEKRFVKDDVKMFTFFYNLDVQEDYEDYVGSDEAVIKGEKPDTKSPAIFMLHNVNIEGKDLLLFYDTGAGGAGISERAFKNLDCANVRRGPTTLSVAGGENIVLPGGDELFSLPHENGDAIDVTALRMTAVTVSFPCWDLTEAWKDINKYYKESNQKCELPSSPKNVGGRPVDILIGMKYYYYHPVHLFSLPCGLSVHRSQIKCSNGNQIVLGGTHKSWRNAKLMTQHLSPMMFLTYEAKAWYFQDQVLRSPISIEDKSNVIEDSEEEFDLDLEVLNDDTEPVCCQENIQPTLISHSTIKTEMKEADSVDSIGSSIGYRCIKCRQCSDCSKGDDIEATSLVEEQEDQLIEMNLRYDPNSKVLIAKLPFIKNPEENLKPNKHIALKVFQSQKRLIDRSPGMKEDILLSFKKLKDKEFVIKVSDLDKESVHMIETAAACYYIPWRSVLKAGSLSTPCRLVFDASSRTPNGASLNECLALGKNLLSSLFKILIKFRTFVVGVTADIQTAYNNIALDSEHYCYQLFLWQDDLDDANPVVAWLVRTLIYGVRPSGTITIKGIRMLAEQMLKSNPELELGCKILMEQTYLDDIIAGEVNKTKAIDIKNQVDEVLAKGSMAVKEYTFSGEAPTEKVSADGVTVGLLGYCWLSLPDLMSLDRKPVFLDKIKRGKLPKPILSDFKNELSECFTKRTLARVVASVYDPIGTAVPITSGLRRDLHEIMMLKTGWDEDLDPKYLDKWAENLRQITELKKVHFKRSIFSEDAEDQNVELLISCDASKDCAVAAVHSRVLKQDGGYHVQLLCAKSKIISTSTIPRGELLACRIGASLGFIAKSVLGEMHTRTVFATDSQICIHWINSDSRPLSTSVRNSVIEIRRFSLPEDWHHVDGVNNIADLGTRSVKDIKQVDIDSEWQRGKPWMSLNYDEMPLKTFEEIKLSDSEKRAAATEAKGGEFVHVAAPDDNHEHEVDDGNEVDDNHEVDDSHEVDDDQEVDDDHENEIDDDEEITEEEEIQMLYTRYRFSNYVPDPALLKWPLAVRVRAAMVKYVRNLQLRVKGKIQLGKFDDSIVKFTEEELAEAELYFFRKATLEVKEFNDKKVWKDHSFEKDEVLYYTGRITDGFIVESKEQIFEDLDPLYFTKPIVDRGSPVAYSIMTYAHEEMARHRCAASTLQQSRTVAFILKGKGLAINVTNKCPACIRWKCEKVQVEMSNIHKNRLVIASSFYFTQCDIFGPYSASCEHNHRSTVKIWGIIFKCCTTLAISVHCMETYSTDSFLAAYSRFNSRYGHPYKIFIDGGSQLVKGTAEMSYEIQDLVRTFDVKHRVGLEVQVAPAGGHNYIGQAERSVLEVKRFFNRMFAGLKLSILNYETAFAVISSELNSLPMGSTSNCTGNDKLDLITPSRLLLGRNNRRAPRGNATLATPGRILKQLDDVKRAWWDAWQKEAIGQFVPGNSKWKPNKILPQVGDICVYLKSGHEGKVGFDVWKIGMIQEVKLGSDGKVREVVIKYKIPGEKVFRSTNRGLRSVAILRSVSDVSLMEKLAKAAKMAEKG